MSEPSKTHVVPSSQQAIVGREGGGLEFTENAPVPELEEDMIMVRNVAVAVNPSDTKMAAPHLVTAGAIAGYDFAGTVVAIGSKCWTPAPIEVGDRVCGSVLGMHNLTPNVGAFAQLVGAVDVALLKIPSHMSFEEAASLGTGIGTTGLALFHVLDVPGYPTNPATKPKTVLVYGGSTATGILALQLLKLSGLKPITTCSPVNFELVKSYGAAEAFDYHSDDCVNQIKAYTKNSLKYVIDCVSEPETMEFCYQCVGRSGGKLATLDPPPKYLNTRPISVKVNWVLGPTLYGKAIGWPPPIEREGDPALRQFAKTWFTTVQQLLDEDKLKPHPLRLMEGGLPAVLEGLDLLKKKKVSGQKLVYPLE